MSKIEEALEKASRIRESSGNKRNTHQENIHNFTQIKVGNQHLIAITQPDSPITEEYRRLKSILIRETKANFLNTIMITSSVETEGKTLTAINLAITLAQEIDHSILLIDADMRKPMVHHYLGIKCDNGLSDYLTRDMDVSEIMVKTGISNLILIPAGHPVENPVELLSSGKMKALMREIKHRYMDRYVIIDTPPILPFADAISIGSTVDGVIFVVKEGRVDKRSIENAMNLIKDLKVLGVVFNNASMETLDGQYSRYYYYNHRKQEKK
ncbi:MAG: polysaccharide biosynthesis tyrosine autokinase [Nitrospirae bacterium]|nr:polysaccharide biosynthesis tyrosine autokinase [Nitrospirota bacterium]